MALEAEEQAVYLLESISLDRLKRIMKNLPTVLAQVPRRKAAPAAACQRAAARWSRTA